MTSDLTHAPPLDLDHAILSDVLDRRRAGRLDGWPAVAGHVDSTQALCVTFVDGSRRLVAKIFHERPAGEASARACSEFEALRVFSLEIASEPRLVAPAPLALDRSTPAYLMTFCSGNPLTRALEDLPDVTIGQIAADIASGLVLYHRAVGESYGDFHPANILLDVDGRTAFLDPGWTNDEYPLVGRALGASNLEADLGYWLFWTAGRLVRRPAHAFRRGAALARLTQHLLREANALRSADPAVAAGVAHEYVRRFLSGNSWRRVHGSFVSAQIAFLGQVDSAR